MHMYYEPKTRSFLRTNRSQFIPSSKYRASQVVCRFMQHGHETESKKENTFPISSCCSVPLMAKDMITRNEMHYKLICMNSTCVHPYCEFGLALRYIPRSKYISIAISTKMKDAQTLFSHRLQAPFGLPKNQLVRLVFSAGTVFFSHNNSARTVFSASFSQVLASRTGSQA